MQTVARALFCGRDVVLTVVRRASISAKLSGYVDLTLSDYRKRYDENGHLFDEFAHKLATVKAAGGEKSVHVISYHQEEQHFAPISLLANGPFWRGPIAFGTVRSTAVATEKLCAFSPIKKGIYSLGSFGHTVINKKLLVHNRLRLLLDEDSDFLEIGEFAGLNMPYGDLARAGLVVGIGKVADRLCVIGANDATVKGGTVFPITVRKQLRAQEIASRLRLPCIYVVDSGGAYLPLQADIFLLGGQTFFNEAIMRSNGIPQVSVVCGSCIAGGAYLPTMTDDAIIVDQIGSLFLGGPPLVKAATGEVVSVEDLGGATVHCRDSGCTDYFATSEAEAFAMCRDVVSCLPQPNEDSARIESTEPIYSPVELRGLAGTDTGGPLFIYQVLARVLDGSRFREFRALFGQSLIAGYGRIGGFPVGLIAQTGCAIDSHSAMKASQFVQICDERSIPLLFVPNSGRFGSGWQTPNQQLEATDNECLKHHAQLLAALSSSTVHKITLVIANCFGTDWFTLCGRSMEPTFVYAWPTARLCICPLEYDFGDSNVAMAERGASLERDSTVWHAASNLWFDKVILPAETRSVLIQTFQAIHSPLLYSAKRRAVIRM